MDIVKSTYFSPRTTSEHFVLYQYWYEVRPVIYCNDISHTKQTLNTTVYMVDNYASYSLTLNIVQVTHI